MIYNEICAFKLYYTVYYIENNIIKAILNQYNIYYNFNIRYLFLTMFNF